VGIQQELITGELIGPGQPGGVGRVARGLEVQAPQGAVGVQHDQVGFTDEDHTRPQGDFQLALQHRLTVPVQGGQQPEPRPGGGELRGQ